MDYRFITDPNNGHKVNRTCKRGRDIIHTYNKYDKLTGGSMVTAGTIGGIMALGGLLLYGLLYNTSTPKDTLTRNISKDLKFIHTLNEESNKNDITEG